MKLLAPAFASLVLALPALAQQVHKCDIGGRKIYQDKPCATGQATTLKVQRQSQGNPTLPGILERERVIRDSINAHYRLQELERERSTLIDRRESVQARMEHELSILRRQKGLAANNLAGAMWEQSLSTEMQAVATRYDGEIDRINAEIASIDRQIAAIKGNK